MTTDPHDRRDLLRYLFGLALAGAVPLSAREAAAQAGLIAGSVCLVQPETTAGPFYFDPELVRSDITDGKAGLPLRLALQVVDADCRPLGGARVDVWHCDARGNYSGYARQGSDAVTDTSGQSFLRGTQVSDDAGVVRFATIYPGWYRGRTAHVHYKVFLDDRTVLTSQLFFPDAVSREVYATAEGYTGRRGRPLMNPQDGIAVRAGDGAIAEVRRLGDGFEAALVVGVRG